MTGNNATYKINIETQLIHLDSLEKELQRIGKDATLNLDIKGQKKLADTLTTLQSFKKILSGKVEDGLINAEDFELFSEMMTGLTRKTDALKTTFAQLLPESVSKEFNKATDDVKNLKEGLGKLIIEYKNLKKGWNINLEQLGAGEMPEPTVATQNKAVASLGVDNITYGDKQISTAKQLLEIYSGIDQSQKNLSAEDQKIVNLYKQYQDILQQWATTKLSELQATRTQINEVNAKIKEANVSARQAENIALQAPDVSPGLKQATEAISDYAIILREDAISAEQSATAARKKFNKEQKETKKEVDGASEVLKNNTAVTDNNTKSIFKNTTQLGRAVNNVISYGTALTLVKKIYGQLISTITDMDKALTDMTVVTDLTREQAWGLTQTLQDLATQTGMTSTVIADMTTKYLQQGKTLNDALVLTEAAAKAARIAGIDGSRSIDLLTNAMNGFQLSADQAMNVSDKFASLAAAAATDYEELATALSKVAAQANLAGMSMDFTLGMLTKGIEVTREAPETIGTALKTVIARMRELTDYGATLDDNIDVNRVAKALDNIGVKLMDENNEFRDLDDVLTEVGMKWENLNKNQQANVAVALAGTRQQSRLIAMLQDFDRTQQLVNISMNSAGSTAAQHRKYMQGLEAATTQVTTAYQQLITTFTNSDFAISALNGVADALNWLGENIGLVKAGVIAIGALAISENLNKITSGITQMGSTMLVNLTQTKVQIELHNVEEAKANQILIEQQLIEQQGILQEKEKIATKAALRVVELEEGIVKQDNIIKEKQETIAINENIIAINKKRKIQEDLTKAEKRQLTRKNTKLSKQIKKANLEAENAAIEKNRLVNEKAVALEEYESKIREKNDQQLAVGTLRTQANTAAKLVAIATGQSSLGISIQEAAIQKLVAMGINEETAARVVNNTAMQLSTIWTSLQILLSHKATKEEKQLARAKLSDAMAQLFKNKVDQKGIVTTTGLGVATKFLGAAIKSLPLIGIIAAIATLVVLFAEMLYESGALDAVINSLKTTLSTVFNIISSVLDIVFDLVKKVLPIFIQLMEIVMSVVVFVIDLVNTLLKLIEGVVKMIQNFVQWIPGFHLIQGFVDKLTDSIKNLGQTIFDWADKASKAMATVAETGAQKVARLSEEIAESQEKIYETRTKSNTLQPLLKEYQELSAKVNKTSEDIDRMNEIADEIGQTDEALIRADGTINVEAVKKSIEESSKIVQEGIESNYEKAIESWESYKNQTDYDKKNNGAIEATEEMRTALSDYFSYQATAEVESGNLTTEQAQSVSSKIQTIFNTLGDEELKKLGSDQDAMKKMYDSMIQFEQDLADSGAENLVEGAQAYEAVLKGCSEEAKKALNSVYTVYADYLRLITELTDIAKEALGSLGLNATDFQKIQRAYTEAWKRSNAQGQEESEEDYANRMNEAFNNWMKEALKSSKSGSKKDALLSLLGNTTDNSVRNALIDAVVKTNQQAVENYTKKTTGLSNLQESMDKAASNQLTIDEWRALMEENQEIFSDADNFENFKAGKLDIDAEIAKNNEELENELQLQKEIANQEIKRLEAIENRSSEEDAQLANYKAQYNLTNIQLEQIKYAALYSTELWKNYAKQTDELRKQNNLQAQLNDLQQTADRNEEWWTTDEKIANLTEQLKLRKDIVKNAENYLNNQAAYNKILGLGAIEVVGGEVFVDADKIRELLEAGSVSNSEILELEKNLDQIKSLEETVYEGTYDLAKSLNEAIIEKQTEETQNLINELDARKEAYENYFDEIDSLTEEEERTQTKDSLVSQISALTGALDSSSKSKIKDLQQQLADLQKEEVEAQRQKQRDAITAALEQQTEDLNTKISDLSKTKIPELIASLEENTKALGNTDVSTVKVLPSTIDATGVGIGTISRLTNDTAPASLTTEEVTNFGVTIEKIEIKTDHLDNNQDFSDAGRVLGEAFSNAIRARGTSTNARK